MKLNGFYGQNGIPGIWKVSVVPDFNEELRSVILEEQIGRQFEALPQAEQANVAAEQMNNMNGLLADPSDASTNLMAKIKPFRGIFLTNTNRPQKL